MGRAGLEAASGDACADAASGSSSDELGNDNCVAVWGELLKLLEPGVVNTPPQQHRNSGLVADSQEAASSLLLESYAPERDELIIKLENENAMLKKHLNSTRCFESNALSTASSSYKSDGKDDIQDFSFASAVTHTPLIASDMVEPPMATAADCIAVEGTFAGHVTWPVGHEGNRLFEMSLAMESTLPADL